MLDKDRTVQDENTLAYQINKALIKSGSCYKNTMILKEDSKVVRCNFECLLWSLIMLLELSIMILESSNMLLENIYSTGVPHDNCHKMIIVCL
jgi:hypothetical protein